MKWSLKIITPPATEPIDLATAKNHLRVDGSNDDALITSLITQAREYAEDYQGKKYITQTLELVLDNFPDTDSFDFRACSPVQSITSVTYYGTDNTEYTFDASNYILDNDSFVNRLSLSYSKSWPSTTLRPVNGVRVRVVVGYGDASAVPETVKFAMVLQMKLLADGTLFNLTPDDRKGLERARDALLGTRRVVPI